MKLKRMTIDNFKGCQHREIKFSDGVTTIYGANATGKSTIMDSFTWLLFGKDSHNNEKFSIRPLDADGKQIDNVDISVSAVIEIDGKEHELHKVQRQNWVKKRGSQDAKLQGNVNSFEVDGFPKKDSEFKAFIAEIIDEDVFKMITSPTYFTSMPWKDQRAILMRFVSDISDVDLAKGNSDFEILLKELQVAPSTDDIQKKYASQKKKLNDTLKELPVRIDEVEKQKVDFDVAELELAKNELERKIAEISSHKIQSDNDYQITNLTSKYIDVETKANKMLNELSADIDNRKMSVKKSISDNDFAINNKRRAYTNTEQAIADYKRRIDLLEDERADLTVKYKECKASAFKRVMFDDSKEICPVCKRPFPDDEIERMRSEFDAKQNEDEKTFNKNKSDRLKNITESGMKVKTDVDELKEKIRQSEGALNNIKDQIAELEKERIEFEQQLSDIPSVDDIQASDEYMNLREQAEKLKAEISSLKSNTNDTSEIDAEIAAYKAELKEINSKIGAAAHNIEIDERIEQLQAEQRETAQKVADAEKMLYALEQFVRFKMDRVSNEINSHFDGIKWVLFETQINGGVKETCECSYNGVRYSDLNSGHKIILGIQIVKALQQSYGVSAPVWCDNAETINAFNMPDVDCQLIRLSVSEDKELMIK